jgi:hypothetical protein
MRTKYEMLRGGTVMFRVWGPDHCGPGTEKDGLVKLRWEVKFQATGALDEKGFLIDNLFIARWMEARAKRGSDLSCELLADELERGLKAAMKEAEPSLQLLTFELMLSPDFGADQRMELRTFDEAGP